MNQRIGVLFDSRLAQAQELHQLPHLRLAARNSTSKSAPSIGSAPVTVGVPAEGTERAPDRSSRRCYRTS